MKVLAAVLGSLLLAALLLYGAVCAWLWSRQEAVLFAPSVLPAGFDLVQGRADVREVAVEVPGARLSALHLRMPGARGLVFFLHGNGGSLQDWFVNPEYYRRLGLDLFMIDYRGYGKSTGSIRSEAQLHADVRAAWEQIVPQYTGRRIVLYGRSLGSGLAAHLAAGLPEQARAPDLTVLVSPYQSLRALMADHYAWVPGALLRYPMRTDEWLPRVRGPVLLIHGERDALIPLRHAEALKALVPAATLLVIPQAAHNDLQDFPVYLDGLAQVLRAL